MRFLIRNRVTACKPVPLFEELEQRIVLDASVDSGISGHTLDASHASQGWNLEYASDPSVSVAPVINSGDLSHYPGSLSDITWAVPPSAIPTNAYVVPGGAGSTGSTAIQIFHQIGGNFYLNDADATPTSLPIVTMSVPAGGGWSNLIVGNVGDATVTGNGSVDSPSTAITIKGTPAAINSVLFTLVGQFPAGYNTGNYWDGTAYVPNTTTIDFNVYDTDTTAGASNPSHPSVYHAYFVDGANGRPNITAPLAEAVNQNVPFDFTGNNLISVTDPDWENSNMQLLYCRVHADNGILNLKDTSSLNRYSHPDDQTWEFEAYLPWINQALGSLEYTGTKAGADTLTVTVNDWGNHGGNGTLNEPPVDGTTLTTGPADQTAFPTQTAREATATININVFMASIDNTPQIDMNPTANMVAGGGPQAIPAAIVTANDADTLDVAVRVHHGALSLTSTPADITTVIDNSGPPGDSLLYLRGPQTVLNYTLNNLLTYEPYTYTTGGNFTGTDILTVTVMDNDKTHLGSNDPVQRTQEQRVILTVA